VNFRRSERVSELLRHEISLYIQEIQDPRLGFVTVTGVEVSYDLGDAKVFFSVLGTDEERDVSSRILAGSVPALRHSLGRKLESLYRIPTIRFVYDSTPERAQRVEELLHRISSETVPDSAVPAPRDEGPVRKTPGKSSRNGKRPGKASQAGS